MGSAVSPDTTASSGSGSGADSPSMAALLTRGYARLGSAVTPSRTKSFAEDFVEAGWDDNSGTKAFIVPSGVVGGGFLRQPAGSNNKVFRGAFATSPNQRFPRVVALDEVTPWWFAFGFRANSPNTTDYNIFGLSDPLSLITVAVGFYGQGPGGVSKYAGYTYNGTTEDDTVSTVSVDGGIHGAEVWLDGTKYWMSIDQETPIQMNHTHLFAGTAVAPCWLSNGAAGRTMDVFWRAGIWPVAYSV